MVDPLEKPHKCNKNFQFYVEKHNIYDVFQDLLKEILITKPQDPLTFIKDQIKRISKGIYNPKAFIVGPKNVAENIGQSLAKSIGTVFFTLDQIIQEADESIKSNLEACRKGEFVNEEEEEAQKQFVSFIQTRLRSDECDSKGFIIYGFPENKCQAKHAQQIGLLPRQVYVFLPDTRVLDYELEEDPDEVKRGSKMSTEISAEAQATNLKDIASVYQFDICKIIPHEKTLKPVRGDLEAELVGLLMTWKPTGGPFIPRVVIMGPPGSGKSSIAEFLSKKFSLVNVDWVTLIRGAERWDNNNAIAAEARGYLKNLAPMTESSVKTILSQRLSQQDCEKKGWILHGFPENAKHCKLLETLYLDPNRVFLISCTKELSTERVEKKRTAALNRQLPPDTPGQINGPENFLVFGQAAAAKRFENFAKSVEGIVGHYGSRIICVDSAMKPSEVKNFVESSIHRPPRRN